MERVVKIMLEGRDEQEDLCKDGQCGLYLHPENVRTVGRELICLQMFSP